MDNNNFPPTLTAIVVAVIIGVFFVVAVIIGLALFAGFFAPAAP